MLKKMNFRGCLMRVVCRGFVFVAYHEMRVVSVLFSWPTVGKDEKKGYM